jgi:hypothetical protein
MVVSRNENARNRGPAWWGWPRLGWLLLWACLQLGGLSHLRAESDPLRIPPLPTATAAESATPDSPLRFRRVFVPRDVLDQVRDPVPYFPLNAAEFEKMVAATNRQVFFRGQNARIVTAIYRANVRENDLIGLEGEWFVELVNGASAILPLGKLTIGLSDPVWADLGGTQVSLLTDREGNSSLYVERSGKVGFRWSARGQVVGGTGAIRFDLALPPAIRNEVELYTSDRFDVAAEGALIFPMSSSSGGLLGHRLVVSDPSRFKMVLQPTRQQKQIVPHGDYHEEIAYELTMEGLEATWQWSLDVLDSPLDALTIVIPQDFRVVEISLGDVALPWEYLKEDNSPTSTVRVQFPEPLMGRDRRVTLRGIASLPLDKAFILPTLRLNQLFWRSAVATVIVRAPLTIHDLNLRSARLRDVSNPVAGSLGTVLEVIHDSPAAETEIVCTISAPEIRQTAVSKVTIGRSEVQANVRLALQGEGTSCFELSWPITPGWSILSVTSSDDSLLEDWQVRDGDPQKEKKTLLVRLKRGLPTENETVFTLTARRDSPDWQGSVFLDEMVPLAASSWPPDGRLYVSLLLDPALAESNAIELEPDVEPVGAAEVNTLVRLQETATSNPVFEMTELTVRPRIRLAPKQLRYLAQIDGTVQLDGPNLLQSFRIRIEPEQTSVSELCILWSEPGAGQDFEWHIIESDGRESPLAVSDRSFGSCSMARGSVLRLPRSFQEPFVVTAQRRSPLQVGPIPLPLLPKASRYEAFITILGSPQNEPEAATVGHWRTSGMELVDRTAASRQSGQSIFAAYRYQGVSKTGAKSIPRLELLDTEAKVPSGIWAVRGIVALRLDASGLLERWHIWEMGGNMKEQLAVRRSPKEPLPDEMIVLVDGQQVSVKTQSDAEGQRIIIQMPRQKQPQRVTVWERFSQPPLFLVSSRQVRQLEPEFPVKQSRTTVWLPPVHVALTIGDLTHWGVFLPDWTVRLFGPLKRPPDQPLFLPDRINRIVFDPSIPPPNLAVRRAIQFQEELGKQLNAMWKMAGPTGAPTERGSQKGEPAAASSQRDSPPRPRVDQVILWRDLFSDDFLDRVHNLPPGLRTVAFLADLESLEDLGIQPDVPVTEDQQEVLGPAMDLSSRAEKFLNHHGMALVVTQNTVVLTSLATVAIHKSEIQWAKPPVYKLDPYSSWWREIENAVVTGDGSRYCRIRLWNDLPSKPLASREGFSDPGVVFAMQGWNATALKEHDFSGNDYVTLIVIREGTLETTRWLGLLIAFALAWLSGFRRRLRILTGILAVAVIVLFVPSPFVPLMSGCFLGSVLALAASLLVRSGGSEGKGQNAKASLSLTPETISNDNRPSQPSATKGMSFGIFILALFLMGGSKSDAVVPEFSVSSSSPTGLSPPEFEFSRQTEDEEKSNGKHGWLHLVMIQAAQTTTRESAGTPTSNNPTTSQPLGSLPPPYRVFIPVDESGKPVGQEVYVPEGLYKELQKRSSPVAAKPTGWHFVAATYRGALAATPMAERWELTQLIANFECWITDAPAQIEIPLGSPEAVPQIGEILLDGRPIAATWDQSRLRVIITESGRCRLQVPIALSPRTDAGANEVRLQIPPVANARLELAAPFTVNRIEVPSALGRVESDPESGRWTAELGSASELVIRWPTSSDPLSDAGPQADLLYRLRLTPTEAIWELRWKFHLNNVRIDQLQMSFDSDLRLDRLSAEGQIQSEELVNNDDYRLFQMKFDSPLKEEGTLVGIFSEPLFAGSGGIRLPEVQLLGMRIARRELLIEDHPGFNLLLRDTVGWKSIDPAAESKNWGITIGEGVQVYEYVSGPTFWGAWVQPQQTTPMMDEQVQLLATQDEIRMRWQARFSSSTGTPGCYHVQVPPGFMVRNVAIVTGAVEQPHPWSIVDDHTLLILLADRLGPESQLVIEGHLPLGSSGEWHFERPSIKDCQVQSLTVTLFRAPDVFVEIAKQSGLELVSSVPQPAANQQSGVFLGALVARPPGQIDLALRIQPNQPSITAEEIVRLTEAGDRLRAEIHLNLTVTAGLLQELKLELPPDWQIDSGANEKTISQPHVKTDWRLIDEVSSGYESGPVKRRLVFSSPQTGRAFVLLTGIGSADEHGHVGVPWVHLPDVSVSRSYLVIPKALTWTSDVAQAYGLRKLSDQEFAQLNGTPNEVGYELTQTDILPPITGVSLRPISWEDAELRVHVSQEGHVLGLMTVRFTGTAAEGLPIQMPKGFRVLSAWLDDRCVPVYESVKGITRVATDTVDDHQLEVLFSGKLSGTGERLDLDLPRPVGAENSDSKRTFLLLQLASGWTPAGLPADPLTAWDYHLTRARRIAEKLLQLWQASERTPEQTSATHQLVKQYRLARDEARRTLLLASQTTTISSAEIRLHNLDLQVSDVLAASGDERAAISSPGAVISERLGGVPSPGMQNWHFECEHFPTRVTLRNRGTTKGWQDLLWGLVIVIVAGSLNWLTRRIRGQLSIWMMRFAHPLVVLAGIGWWLWLCPGVVGWLLILAALGLLIRSRWQWVPKEEAAVPLIVHQKVPAPGNTR